MMKIASKKNLYLVFLFVVMLLGFALSPTYAKFPDSYVTDNDVVGLSLDFNIGISNIEEYEEVVVKAKSEETFYVKVDNASDKVMYYGIWYKMVSPSEITDDIFIGRSIDNVDITSGEIESLESKTVSITIVNNSDEEIEINLGVASSVTGVNDIEYLGGKRLITGVVSKPKVTSVVQIDNQALINASNAIEGVTKFGVSTSKDKEPTSWSDTNSLDLPVGTYYAWVKNEEQVNVSDGVFTVTKVKTEKTNNTKIRLNTVSKESVSIFGIKDVSFADVEEGKKVIVTYEIKTDLEAITNVDRLTCLAKDNTGSLVNGSKSDCISDVVSIKEGAWKKDSTYTYTNAYIIPSDVVYNSLYLKLFANDNNENLVGYSTSIVEKNEEEVKVISPLDNSTHNGLKLWLDARKNYEGVYNRYLDTNMFHDLSTNNNLVKLSNGVLENWTYSYFQFNGIKEEYGVLNNINLDNVTVVATYSLEGEGSQHIVSNINNGGYGLLVDKDSYIMANVFTDKLHEYKVDKPNVVGTVYHDVMTYDSKNINFMRNGIKLGSTEVSSTGIKKSDLSNMVIGGYIDGDGNIVGDSKLKLYSLRIYDRALSIKELETIYNYEKERYGF